MSEALSCPEIQSKEGWTVLSIVKKAGNALLMGGGIAFAIAPVWAATPWSFLPFMVGHFLWIVAGRIERDRDLIILNAFMMMLDIVAIAMRAFPDFKISIFS